MAPPRSPASYGATQQRPIIAGRPVPRPRAQQPEPVQETVVDDSETLLDYDGVDWEVPSSEEEYARTLAMLHGSRVEVAQEQVSGDVDEGFVEPPIDREWT